MIFTNKIFAIIVTIFIHLFIICDTADLSNEDGKLVAASIIFRHGDRTPISPYPNDPYKDPKLWPAKWGQLTNTGKRQHFELGKWFRQRYNSLVSEKYNPEEIYVRSTDVDRTLMSVQSNLAGFYPPVGQDVWNEDLLWQPIPIHTIPEDQDSLVAAKKPCNVYDIELKKLHKSPEWKAWNKKFKPIYDYLTANTGKQVDSLNSAQYIYSCLHIEQIYNFTLPEWTKKVYPDKLLEISGLSFAVKTYTPLLARLKSGPLLKEILTHFQDKLEGDKKRNLWIYSAHDTTVANMLNTLGVFQKIGYHNPPYTATILFELREINQEHYVQVYYKNTTTPVLLDLPKCGTLCPLDKMFEVYKEVLPVDWEQECQLSLLQMPLDINVDESLSFMTIFGFIGLMLFVGVIVLYIATVYNKRRDYLTVEKWNINEWN